jgi:DNA-directed RNA polymerase subunit RPC12/RpoP/uncharacterized integral membrane protein
MLKGILGRLAKVWTFGIVVLSIVAVFVIPYRRGVSVPILSGQDAAATTATFSFASFFAEWAIPIILGLFVAISVWVIVAAFRKSRVSRIVTSFASAASHEQSAGSATTDAGSITAAQGDESEQALICSRCGAEATKQFGFTQELVCSDCHGQDGVCGSCGKQFGSDAELIVISAGKNCRECDARLDAMVSGGFRTSTRFVR